MCDTVTMVTNSRRDFLKYAGMVTVATGIGSIGTTSARSTANRNSKSMVGTLELLGHAFLENPPGAYTHGAVRDDGRYGLLGSYYGEGGSFLVDLEDLENPTQAHRLPSAMTNRQNDVKFDSRDGLYYRTQEPNVDDGEQGFEIIDYGFEEGTVEDPEIISRLETPRTGVHNLQIHPDESILYVVDDDEEAPGILVTDVSDPADPTIEEEVGPNGYCHDVEVDPDRDHLHAAYIGGDFVGYVIYDLSDPLSPEELGRVDYAERPDYEEIGTPGFESCHQASFDPERDLAIIGDEVGSGIPGGKHIFDIGWDEGSPENPIHIGFTHSPNADEQGEDEPFFWTTHFHDVVPESATDGGATLLVDGGYHEGTWVCDITNPRNPVPSQQFQTRENEQRAEELGSGPVIDFLDPLHPPFVWSAEYNAERDFVFASDSLTGAYVFEVSDEEFEFRTVEEELAQSFDPTDEIGEEGLELARHYCEEHRTVPNTGGERITSAKLQEIEAMVGDQHDEDDGDSE